MKNILGGLIGIAALSMAAPLAAQTPETPPDAGLPTPDATAGEAPVAEMPASDGPVAELPPDGTSADAPAEPPATDTAAAGADAPADDGMLPTIAVPETPPPVETDREANPSRLIEEVVVTAQKREENLQDVPISVAAFTGDELEARGVNDPTALAAITPGLTYNNLVGYSLIYIRGVGSDAFEPTADQSVATYIDGVYLPFAHGLAQEFVKLERIEVLKGPQGTLFGRNATGGAINIITRKPTDALEIDLDGTLAKFSDREAKAFISGPIFDTLKGSISGDLAGAAEPAAGLRARARRLVHRRQIHQVPERQRLRRDHGPVLRRRLAHAEPGA